MVAPSDMDTEAPSGIDTEVPLDLGATDLEADSEDSVTRIKLKNQLAHLALQGGL